MLSTKYSKNWQCCWKTNKLSFMLFQNQWVLLEKHGEQKSKQRGGRVLSCSGSSWGTVLPCWRYGGWMVWELFAMIIPSGQWHSHQGGCLSWLQCTNLAGGLGVLNGWHYAFFSFGFMPCPAPLRLLIAHNSVWVQQRLIRRTMRRIWEKNKKG